jgi:hypothetical protein
MLQHVRISGHNSAPRITFGKQNVCAASAAANSFDWLRKDTIGYGDVQAILRVARWTFASPPGSGFSRRLTVQRVRTDRSRNSTCMIWRARADS